MKQNENLEIKSIDYSDIMNFDNIQFNSYENKEKTYKHFDMGIHHIDLKSVKIKTIHSKNNYSVKRLCFNDKQGRNYTIKLFA